MPTTGAPANIWFPDENAPVAPLENLFLELAASVNIALATRHQIQTYKWADESERLNEVGMSEGDRGTQLDTKTEWVRGTSEWEPVGAAPFAIAAGTANVDQTFPLINFPAGRFTVPPIVVAQLMSGAGADLGLTVMVTAITATSFRARHSAASGTKIIHWYAIQMTPDSAAG